MRKVIMTKQLLIHVPLKPKNNDPNLLIVYCQISGRYEVINFCMKTGSTLCRGCFFCPRIVDTMSLLCGNCIKHKQSDFFSIRKNFFFYTKDAIWEKTHYSKFLVPIKLPNFLSHFVSTDMSDANQPSNI